MILKNNPLSRIKSKWLRRSIVLAAVIFACALGAELFARFYLGLGDPPLSIADPEIEYMFKPSMGYKRFGNSIRYNAFSMRSSDLTAKKTDPSETRILVIGDSIVNGGASLDDSKIATTLLQRQLEKKWHRPAFVGNVSAGSWGPENMLAYTRRFGWFDASYVILVLSSHDYADVPTFEPLVGVSSAFPARKPLLATQEAIERYLPRYLGKNEPPVTPQPSASDIDRSLRAVHLLIQDARAAGAQISVIQHVNRQELLSGRLEPGHDLIAETVREMGAPLLQLQPSLFKADPTGQRVYLDEIHLNAEGQALLADLMFQILSKAPTTTQAQ